MVGAATRASTAVVFSALVFASCTPDPVFFCQSSDDCGPEGRCEVDGFCTFADDTCASGRRYGELAGAGKAGTCLTEAAMTGTGDTTPDDAEVDDGTTIESPVPTGTTQTPLPVDSTGSSGPPPDTSTGPQPTDDTGSTGLGEGLIQVDDEIIEVLPGWTGGVWYDFSDQFDYLPVAYDDPPASYSNAPFSIVALEAPFDVGLALISVHTVIELSAAADYTEWYFFQAKGNAGPDALWDAVLCDVPFVASGLCIGSGSQDAGDGLFVIDADWTIQQVASTNNVNGIGVDPDGGLGLPQIIYGTPNGIFEYPDTQLHTGDFRNLLLPRDDRLIAVRHGDGVDDLLSIDDTTGGQELLRTEAHSADPITFQHPGAIKLVEGVHSQIDGDWFALVQTQSLLAYSLGGEESQIAATVEGQGWRWVAAVVPHDAHPLAEDGPIIFIVEANRADDRDRVIWLRPS